MPPRRATTLRAPCALDGAASRLHLPSAFATVGALERCPSGRRGTPGERVYPQGTEGSNPSLSVSPFTPTGTWVLWRWPRGLRAVAARSCARRRREPRQVRKEAAVPNVLLCRRVP